MNQELAEIYQLIVGAHARAYAILDKYHKAACKTQDKEELAEWAYACREIAKFSEDIKKEANRVKQSSEKMCCALWAQGEDSGPIRTPHCTATPDIKMMSVLPNRTADPAAYSQLLTHLGVPEDLQACDAMRIHYPGMVEYNSTRVEEGKPPMPGVKVGGDYPVYKLRIRGKKDVAEE